MFEMREGKVILIMGQWNKEIADRMYEYTKIEYLDTKKDIGIGPELLKYGGIYMLPVDSEAEATEIRTLLITDDRIDMIYNNINYDQNNETRGCYIKSNDIDDAAEKAMKHIRLLKIRMGVRIESIEYENRHVLLYKNIKAALPALEELFEEVELEGDGLVYKFYSGSFKVFYYKDIMKRMLKALQDIALANRGMEKGFCEIAEYSFNKSFEWKDNADWQDRPQKIVESFLHLNFILEQVIKIGKSGTVKGMPASVLLLYRVWGY